MRLEYKHCMIHDTKHVPARPELLAPAGDQEMLRAAVANGADAVYLGLEDFNARRRAENFSLATLPQTMDYLHDHNVRGYVAFNTLVFQSELDRAAEFVAGIAAAGADAIIVQDLGVARMIREIAPSLPIHASTQATQSHYLGARHLADLGIKRIILARELSIEQLRQIQDKCEIELEVFVHGAICISYSGQCLASAALLGRSGNRGLCGQLCRLPYQLIIDGKSAGPTRYLLSPRDLAAYDLIAQLLDAGLRCFKIEGRLKGPHYVAAVVQAYRAAIDGTFNEKHHRQLLQSFSRGFTHGYLKRNTPKHPPSPKAAADFTTLGRGARPPRLDDLVPGDQSDRRGEPVGRITAVQGAAIMVRPEAGAAAVRPGDGVVMVGSRGEQGGRVYFADPAGRGMLKLIVKGDSFDVRQVQVGSELLKTDDPQVRKELEQSYSRDTVVHTCRLDLEVQAKADGLTVTAEDADGNQCQAHHDAPLEAALKHPLTIELLREQLGRLGGTPFQLGQVRLLDERGQEAQSLPVLAPKSVLNDLRRQIVEQLVELRRKSSRHEVVSRLKVQSATEAGRDLAPEDAEGAEIKAGPMLHVLVRSINQLCDVLAWRRAQEAQAGLIYGDFANVDDYRRAAELAARDGAAVAPALPRILKPGDESLVQAILALKPRCMLVRNPAELELTAACEAASSRIADFSLNAVNELSADYLRQMGFDRVTTGCDLSWNELQGMLRRIDPSRLEVVIHQHVPLFHMEHALAEQADGASPARADVPSAAKWKKVELQDRNGERHLVLRDGLRRTTAYNSYAQSACEFVGAMRQAGVRHFRVELLDEQDAGVQELLDAHASLLAGRASGDETWRRLKPLCSGKLTRGLWSK